MEGSWRAQRHTGFNPSLGCVFLSLHRGVLFLKKPLFDLGNHWEQTVIFNDVKSTRCIFSTKYEEEDNNTAQVTD